MTLKATIALTLGSLALDVQIGAAPGEVIAVLGPNGSGKTSLLRALAGLVPLRAGRVELEGKTLEDPETGVRTAADERQVGYVFQDYLLFPHLSVLENVAFGLRARGTPRKQAHERAMRLLEPLGLTGYAQSKPSALSGGQAQRVALARALATQPRLLLLDEPLSALDAGTKVEVRRELSRHLSAFEGSTLIVTHNLLEAAALASRLVVLEAGRVVQEGTFSHLAAQPRSPYVAELVGLNLLRGRGVGDSIELESGGTLIAASHPKGPVFAAVHPRAISLHRAHPEGSPRNVWEAQIGSLDLEGDRVRVTLVGAPSVVAEVTPEAAAELGLARAERVWASLKATEIAVYPV
ncbi:MAG: sulfate/molybdate ABC transporter ATP-binding protein [Actinomycetota bacterium]